MTSQLYGFANLFIYVTIKIEDFPIKFFLKVFFMPGMGFVNNMPEPMLNPISPIFMECNEIIVVFSHQVMSDFKLVF